MFKQEELSLAIGIVLEDRRTWILSGITDPYTQTVAMIIWAATISEDKGVSIADLMEQTTWSRDIIMARIRWLQDNERIFKAHHGAWKYSANRLEATRAHDEELVKVFKDAAESLSDGIKEEKTSQSGISRFENTDDNNSSKRKYSDVAHAKMVRFHLDVLEPWLAEGFTDIRDIQLFRELLWISLGGGTSSLQVLADLNGMMKETVRRRLHNLDKRFECLNSTKILAGDKSAQKKLIAYNAPWSDKAIDFFLLKSADVAQSLSAQNEPVQS